MNVQHERMRLGLTQAELADQLCVTRGLIAQIERGFKAPPLSLAIQLADIFQTTVDALTKEPK